jgi:hypothetical protein
MTQEGYSLESEIVPFLDDFKVDGHELGALTPALPLEFNLDSSSAFCSEAVCAVCGASFFVEWRDGFSEEPQSIRIGGTILTADGCRPSLRQPAA